MRIFLAGAAGVLGRRIVPLLLERGHEVAGMTRSRAEAVRALGAEPVVADALDREAVEREVAAFRPDVVVHELTSLTRPFGSRNIARTFAQTNRLRTEGTDNLVAAARAAGGARVLAQSFGGWPYAREGGPVKTEDDPLDPDPVGALRPMHEAIVHLERTVVDAGGVVLRYGTFYGPGTSFDRSTGEMVEMVEKRRLPLIGGGGGVWSFVHLDDAAQATVAAIDRAKPGIYNVVDDDPAPVSEWLPALAAAVGAKPPRPVPAWLARLLAGQGTVVMMTDIRGASNAKAKRELGWEPRYPSWREGFATGI